MSSTTTNATTTTTTTSEMAQIDKEGFLLKRPYSSGPQKKKLLVQWKQRYFVLRGGSLLCYSNKDDAEPKSVFNLKGCTVSEATSCGKDHAFMVTRSAASASENKEEEIHLIVSCKTEDDMKSWIEHITKNLDKEPANIAMKRRRETPKELAQRLIVNATASTAGMHLIKELDSDVGIILDSMKKFAEMETGDTKLAEKYQRNVIKLISRVLILHKDGVISREVLESAELESMAHDTCGKILDGHEITFTFNLEDLIHAIDAMEQLLHQTFRPYFDEKNQGRLKDLFAFYKDKDRLFRFYKDPKYKEVRVACMTALRELWNKKLI